VEPLCERIVEAIVDRLKSGSEYTYHPDRVIRSPAWGSHCLDESLAAEPTIYTLSPDDEDTEELTYGSTKSSLGIDLTIAHKFHPAGESTPLSVTLDPDRWKVQNRLRDDARKRLRGDLKVGNLALIIQIPLVDLSAEETAVEGWAVVMMRLLVQYSYPDAE
jgi:hypothetical protein